MAARDSLSIPLMLFLSPLDDPEDEYRAVRWADQDPAEMEDEELMRLLDEAAEGGEPTPPPAA